MATTTTIELDTLDRDGSKPISEDPAIALVGPANASIGVANFTTGTHATDPAAQTLPKGRSWIVIIQLAGINFITSFTNGLITVALPAIAMDLNLAQNLLLWPSSAFALTSGSCLLLAGSFADVVGSRSVNLVGCFFVAAFTLVCGFPQTGIELIMFRAFQGIASALTFPSISIISNSIESGRRRTSDLPRLDLQCFWAFRSAWY